MFVVVVLVGPFGSCSVGLSRPWAVVSLRPQGTEQKGSGCVLAICLCLFFWRVRRAPSEHRLEASRIQFSEIRWFPPAGPLAVSYLRPRQQSGETWFPCGTGELSPSGQRYQQAFCSCTVPVVVLFFFLWLNSIHKQVHYLGSSFY